MNGILGSDQYNDKIKKKPFYNNARRHYNSHKPTASMTVNQKQLPRSLLAFVCFFIFLMYIYSSTKSNSKQVQLRDQPVYTPQQDTCVAKLCNPVSKCSTWKPNKKYSWVDLSNAGIFRDLYSVQLSPGCELNVKVDEDEWLTIPEGYTECVESGYGYQCRNLIDIDFKENILIKARQMKDIMKDISSQSQEVILVQRAMATPSNQNMDVTMITQFSVNRLETFKNAIHAWPGYLSIAIYLTNPTDLDELIEFFKAEDNLDLYSRATISLVKPNYLDNSHLSYPINHLRNIAITEASTEYIFVIDADFIPSANLYNYIRTQLMPYIVYQGSSIPRTAWVVPCFAILEAFSDIPIPSTYDELRKLIGQGIAYVTDPGAGHGPTLAVEVAMVRSLLLGNTIAYEVCYESQWEPYYVVHRSAPLYDARFRNQGGDKQSHTLQLNAEKYRFMVLRDVFMIHRDHSTMVWPGGGFEKTQKESTHWNYFEDFMQEMKELYGSNVRWPRGCSADAIGWQEQRRDTLGFAAGAV